MPHEVSEEKKQEAHEIIQDVFQKSGSLADILGSDFGRRDCLTRDASFIASLAALRIRCVSSQRFIQTKRVLAPRFLASSNYVANSAAGKRIVYRNWL